MNGRGRMNERSTGIKNSKSRKEYAMKSGTGLRVLATYALLGALLGIPLTVQANVTVTMLDDSGPGSLRQAIADAVSGDTIDFAVTGMIRLTTGGLII
jgi:hypothetical protein